MGEWAEGRFVPGLMRTYHASPSTTRCGVRYARVHRCLWCCRCPIVNALALSAIVVTPRRASAGANGRPSQRRCRWKFLPLLCLEWRVAMMVVPELW